MEKRDGKRLHKDGVSVAGTFSRLFAFPDISLSLSLSPSPTLSSSPSLSWSSSLNAGEGRGPFGFLPGEGLTAPSPDSEEASSPRDRLVAAPPSGRRVLIGPGSGDDDDAAAGDDETLKGSPLTLSPLMSLSQLSSQPSSPLSLSQLQ